MQDDSQNKAINKPRQCGISTTEAADCAWELYHIPGTVILVVSKDKDAAGNFLKYVKEMMESVRTTDKSLPEIGKMNEFEITVPSMGSRIVVQASTAGAGRSFSATKLVLDEAAYQQYAYKTYHGASASLAQTGGKLRVISTPNGRANLFYDIFDAPMLYHEITDKNGVVRRIPDKNGINQMGFKIFDYKWWDVPSYNPVYKQYKAAKNHQERNYWVNEARKGEWYRKMRPKYTKLAWEAEFEGSFDASENTVFNEQQLFRTFKQNYLPQVDDLLGVSPEYYKLPAEKGHYYVSGVDVGRKRDATVIITYDITPKVARVVEFKYIPAGYADWPLIEKSIRETYKNYNNPDIFIDGTGSGDPLAEAIGDIIDDPIVFTLSRKQAMIETTRLAMDNGDIEMPKIKQLYTEHQKYEWDDKNIRQDCVMANILAVSGFYEPAEVFIGFKDVSFAEDVAW